MKGLRVVLSSGFSRRRFLLGLADTYDFQIVQHDCRQLRNWGRRYWLSLLPESGLDVNPGGRDLAVSGWPTGPLPIRDVAALFDAALGYRPGLVVMIQAYLDESVRTGGAFAVACYGFFPARAREAEKKLRQLLGGRIFHTTDLVALQGEFRDLERRESDAILRSAIEVIRETNLFGVVVSCYPNNVGQKDWPQVEGLRGHYATCIELCLTAAKIWLDQLPDNQKIAYFIERGYRDEGEIRLFFSNLREHDLRGTYGMVSENVIGKQDAVLLGASDLLAWEWTKYVEETLDPPSGKAIRPQRKSLARLLEPHKPRWRTAWSTHGIHFFQSELAEHLAEKREAIRELQEEASR